MQVNRFLSSGAVAAFVTLAGASWAHADCNAAMNEYDAALQENVQYRVQLSGTVQQDLRKLRNAAYTLQQHGQTAACEEVIAAMNAIVDQPDVGENTTSAEDAWLKREQERLANAKPLKEVSDQLSAERLIGADVRNDKAEDLGEVADIAFSQSDGSSYVIISRGGFMGLGEDQIAIPFDHLKSSPDFEVLYTGLSLDQIEYAPTFESGDLGWLQDDEARQRIDSYFDG
jgi:sporulation protein YlmC with PRC-barrel domain